MSGNRFSNSVTEGKTIFFLGESINLFLLFFYCHECNCHVQTEDTFTGLLLLSERKWMKSLTQTIQPLLDTVDIFST